MDLVKTVLRLVFTEALHPWIELRDLFRIAGEDQTAEIQGQPVVVLRPRTKERITLQVREIVLEQEALKSLPRSISEMTALLEKVNRASPLPPIQSCRFDAMFVESFQLPFHELLARTKEEFLRPQPLVNTATDVGLSLDISDGETTRHLQIGPMVPDQLRAQFLVFPRERLPTQFLFIDVARSRSTASGSPYQPDGLAAFLKESSSWQSSESRAIAATITRGRNS